MLSADVPSRSHEAHERGLVHRDLKPSNIMVCEVALIHDFVKVLDFGLAKTLADTVGHAVDLVGTTTGTPGYMAPETALGGGDVDHRADIYGLGCVAYFLLTGTPVFEEADPMRDGAAAREAGARPAVQPRRRADPRGSRAPRPGLPGQAPRGPPADDGRRSPSA